MSVPPPPKSFTCRVEVTRCNLADLAVAREEVNAAAADPDPAQDALHLR